MYPTLAALADPLRIRIVEKLTGGEYAVGHLASELGCAQSTLSKALRVLRDADLVAVRSAGQLRYYGLKRDRFDELSQWAARRAGERGPEVAP